MSHSALHSRESYRSLIRRKDLVARFDGVALFHDGPTLDFEVKQVHFLIAVDYVSFLVDPEERVLDALAFGIVAGFVYSDRDWQRIFPGIGLETKDEWRFTCWEAQ